MHRRRFAHAMIASILALPLSSSAQRAPAVARIGLLLPTSLSDPRTAQFLDAFRDGLRDLGYAEGRNITTERRFADEQWDRLPGLAADLVRAKVDLIVTYTTPAAQAAKQATSNIPIVVAAVIDPVAAGLVVSLAHPGSNITGLSQMVPELIAKHLEILKEVAPSISLVAVLGNPANPGTTPQVRHAQAAARALGMRVQPVEARVPGEIENGFAAITRERAGAVVVLIDSMLIDHRRRIVDLAARRRLPTVSATREIVDAGGLMSYGPSVRDMFRHAAIFVDKILKGAKPADLPVEQPTKFELVINLKTAKALGLTIPPSLRARADQMVQ